MVFTIIRGHRLEGFINGQRPSPEQFITTGIRNSTESQISVNPEYENWLVYDQLLMGWLYGSMTEGIASEDQVTKKVVLEGVLKDGLYQLKTSTVSKSNTTAGATCFSGVATKSKCNKTSTSMSDLCNMRLGHPSNVVLSQVLKIANDSVMPEVNEQLTGANEILVELLVGGVLKELGEVNKQIVVANKLIEDLRKEIKDMPSTTKLEEELKALTKEVNTLKDERESLRTLLQNQEAKVIELTGEKTSLQETLDVVRVTFGAEWEALQKEVESLEIVSLDVFYEFWKANPEANFDYLKEDLWFSFLSLFEAQKV
uniref:Uncharacterized protein n=1 Tax=Cannabis sativa TaxID=3483 RepID=A0A803QIK5_CANSA